MTFIQERQECEGDDEKIKSCQKVSKGEIFDRGASALSGSSKIKFRHWWWCWRLVNLKTGC